MSWTEGLQWADQELMTEVKLDAQEGRSEWIRNSFGQRVLVWSHDVSASWWTDDYTGSPSAVWPQVRLKWESTAPGSSGPWYTNAAGAPISDFGSGGEPPWQSEVYLWEIVSTRNNSWTRTTQDITNTSVVCTVQFAPELSPTVWGDVGDPILDVANVRITEEIAYFSAWAEIFPYINAGPMTNSVTNRIGCAIKNVFVIASDTDKNYPHELP